jgi:hypothetical protein
LNTLFLTCALAFISIANAQEVRVIDNKGTIKKILIPTRAELFDTNGGFEITDNIVIIQFNAQGIIDLNDYDVNTTSIKVKKTGTYKVTYRVTTRITSDTEPTGSEDFRSGAQYVLYKNSSDEVLGSYSATYNREYVRSKDTASASQILDLEKDDVLTVRGNRYAASSTVKTVANGSSFLVERIN